MLSAAAAACAGIVSLNSTVPLGLPSSTSTVIHILADYLLLVPRQSIISKGKFRRLWGGDVYK